jgi:hypothetical protein
MNLRQNFSYWSSDQFFVCFRQLTADSYSAIAHDQMQLLKGPANAVWGLEEYDGSSDRLGALKPLGSGF